MSETRIPIHPDALELARLLEPTWPETSARLWDSGAPLNAAPGQDPAAPAAPEATPAPAEATPEATPAAPSIDYDRIESLLGDRFQAMEQTIDSRLPAPAPTPQADPFDALTPLGYDDQERQALQGVLQPLFQGVLSQALGPLQQQNEQLQGQLQRLTTELDAGDLEERYPALQNQETYAPVAQEALQMAQQLGMQVQDPALVPPRLIEQAYLAQLGRERIASETPAPGANPGLEGAGGATPPPEQPDVATNIVNARGPRTQATQFWGA